MAVRLMHREMLRYTGLAAAAGLVAACQPVPSAPAGGETVAPAEATKPAPVEEITLSVPNIWGGSRVPLMDDMFARFSEAHPGMTVENVLVPGGERLQKLQTGIAGGTPPDVPMFGTGEVPMLASRKSIIALDEYMARDGVRRDEYYEYIMGGAEWEGEIYVLPNVSSAWALQFYNVSHYEEAGLDPDNPPKTWEELTAAAKTLTIMEGEEIKRLGYQFYHGLPGQEDFHQALVSNGGEFLSQDKRTVLFNSEAGLQALNWLLDTLNQAYGSIATYQDWTAVQGAEDITNPFISETLSSAFRGVWDIYYIKAGNPELNYRVGLLPGGPNGESHVAARSAWGYGIPVGVPHPDASWELVEWLSHEPTAACWFLQQQGRPSPLKACNEDPFFYQEFPNTWPNVIEMVDSAVLIPLTPADTEMVARLSTALEEAAHGVRTPEEALNWAAAECQTLLDEAWTEMD